jgi:hypothetical protein
MPQKGHTSGGGGKKGKKKSGRMATSDQDTTQLEEEQEQQQPLSATFSDNARFEDLAANIENPETDKEVLQPRTESLVAAPQQAEDKDNSIQSVTEAEYGKTTRQNVQPGRSNGTTRAVGTDSLRFGGCGGGGRASRARGSRKVIKPSTR